MLEPGQPAPDFTLPDQGGEPVTLSDRRGETVVLYFYPRADTYS
jgi:thioredoxin-dependent peroxiredoxin